MFIDWMGFESSWWLIPLWIALFTVNDYLTILVAKRYDLQDPPVIEFQGGYELAPQYKREISEHRLFGPAFLRTLVIYSGFLLLMRWVTGLDFVPRSLYSFVAGAAILLSVAVNVRHAQNLVFFGVIPVPEPVEGHISYPASFSYRGSSVGFLAFAFGYLLIGTVSASWFILGGAFASFITGFSHWRLSNRSVPAENPDG